MHAPEVPDAAMITRYNQAGPRYTSYPPAPYWSNEYSESDFRSALAGVGSRDDADEQSFSLYVHIPFCERRCTFCACNVVISRAHSRGMAYIDQLTAEMDLVRGAMASGNASSNRQPRVMQMHWGGGTPTWLSASELDELCRRIADRFDLLSDREQSIEVDPRVTTIEQLGVLRRHGLTRISMGVQDLDLRVQRAVNRVQSREQTESLIRHARDIGVRGVNIDLIYGLPHQSLDGFGRTVEAAIEMNVDRVALYNFAWLPHAIKHHSALRPEMLPPAEVRIELFRQAAARFTAAGYVMIGLDHFAKRDDELTHALADGTLQRNFMGYTTRGGGHGTVGGSGLLSFGVSSISRIGRDFAQNFKSTGDYGDRLGAGVLPVHRGLSLSDDDLAREHIIQSIMCFGQVDFDLVQQRFGRDLMTPRALEQLEGLADDGLVEVSSDQRQLSVLPLGRYFLRNIAMTFDAYLGQPQGPREGSQQVVQVGFSRTV